MAKNKKYWQRRLGAYAKALDPYVNHIDLRSITDLDDDGLEFILQNVKGVNMLDLNETEITNKSMALLPKLEYVHELRLKGCYIYNDCIPNLDRLGTLTFLYVRGTKITIDGLLQLTNLPGLKTLMFSSADAPDPAFADKMQQLRKHLPSCEFVVDSVPYNFGDREWWEEDSAPN